jgi:guanine nucleotide-binding protein subunit alpha-12
VVWVSGEATKMASVMWSCPCCLRFKFSPEEIEQRYRSQEIDKMIEKDKHSFRRQVKLLLLGAGESGKSTFLKQMRIIHGMNFEPELVKEYHQVIYQNVVKGMKVLVDARNKLHIPWENPHNSESGNFILKYDNNTYLDARLFSQYAPILYNLWRDAGIRRAFERRREFQLSDSVQYFLDNLERIARLVCTRLYSSFLWSAF